MLTPRKICGAVYFTVPFCLTVPLCHMVSLCHVERNETSGSSLSLGMTYKPTLNASYHPHAAFIAMTYHCSHAECTYQPNTLLSH